MKKEEFEKELSEHLRNNIDVKLTEQAWNVVSRFDDFPKEHWFKFVSSRYNSLGGGQMLEYLDRMFPKRSEK